MSMQLLKQPSETGLSELNQALRRRFWKNPESVIAPITNSDRDLYKRFFQRDNRVACYGNSWTYITQACRGIGSGLGLKYYDDDLLLSVGCYKSHYVIVRPLGRFDERIIEFLGGLCSASGKPVFIKKLFPDQVASLQELGNFDEAVGYSEPGHYPGRGGYPWLSHESFADDDTYPEIILDVNLTLDYEKAPKSWLAEFKGRQKGRDEVLEDLLHRYLKFRSKVNKFANSGVNCRLEEYDVEMAEVVRRFLTGHFGEKDEENVEAYENMVTRLPLGSNGNSFFSFVAYLEHRPLPQGFFVAEQLDNESAGLYAAIASRCCPGLSEYLHVEMLSRLKRKGIRLLNIGGSEVKSLHEFKLKFAPVEERYMKMLVYGAPQRSIAV